MLSLQATGRILSGICAIAALGAFAAPARAGEGACAEPPPWTAVYARPGRPFDEIWGCLNDAAWRARDVRVPENSKVGGIIAQCEVEVDHFEGRMVFGGFGPSEARQAEIEQRVEQEARTAIAAAAHCSGH